MAQAAAMMGRLLPPRGASSCAPLSSSTAAPPPPSRTASCTVCHGHLQCSSRSSSPSACSLPSVPCSAKSSVTLSVTSSMTTSWERPLSRTSGGDGQRRMASLSFVSAQHRLSFASLQTQQQQQHQRQKQKRRRGGPPPPRAAGGEVSSDTYWVTVANAVAVVVGIGGTGVVTGLLLRYKLWQDAKREIEKMKAEGMNPEEIFAKAEAAAAAAEEQQKMMMGSSLAAAVEESAADEDTAPAAAAATAGEAPVETAAQAGATGTTAAEVVAASTGSGSGSGRRNRPVVRE